MAKAQDFILDSDGDILIQDGDFVIGESDGQHIRDIMSSVPGWFKEFPFVGFNPYQFLNSRSSVQQQSQLAKIQLESDGYVVDANQLSISIDSDGKISGTISAIRPEL